MATAKKAGGKPAVVSPLVHHPPGPWPAKAEAVPLSALPHLINGLGCVRVRREHVAGSVVVTWFLGDGSSLVYVGNEGRVRSMLMAAAGAGGEPLEPEFPQSGIRPDPLPPPPTRRLDPETGEVLP